MYDTCFATQSYKRPDHKNTVVNYKLFMRWLWLISIHTSGSIFVITKRNVKIPIHVNKKPVNILVAKEFRKKELFSLPCKTVFYMDFNTIINGTITSHINKCTYICQVKNTNSLYIINNLKHKNKNEYLYSRNTSIGLYLDNITIPYKWTMQYIKYSTG